MLRSLLVKIRKWHRWVSIFIALPFLVTVITGLLLASRGFNTWVQPKYPALQSDLKITFDQVLEITKAVPEAEVKTWKDVSQIDIRPSTGNIRVRSKNLWEIQIDGTTGAISSSAMRRVGWLTGLHEGAEFGPWIRYGVFFPSSVAVLFLLISGVMIFFQPILNRRKLK